ncbi:MAG: sensor histidine kinase [Pseudonocardiaceae bacterium]|nr:sensor histidine kinase [Pseudonocardiaceae bacterium]
MLGAVTAVAELGFLAAATGALLLDLAWPRLGLTRAVHTGARTLTELNQRRLTSLLRAETAEDYTDRQALRYLMVRWLVGVLGGLVLVLLALGVAFAATMLAIWLTALPVDQWIFGEEARVTWVSIVGLTLPGIVLLYINLQGVAGVAGLDRSTAARFLGPSERELLQQRIAELATSRAGIVDAVDAERRRIERDLHDGLQQRLVALGVLLGRARRSRHTGNADELLRQAHEQAQHALDELREVAWRAYPTALDNLGLQDSLATVAEQSSVPTTIHYGLTERPATQVETAIYFVVSEAVTNAAKHAHAEAIAVHVERRDTMLAVRVRDDGVGGADRNGGGLSGLARRVAALDGRFDVDSPAGGPTTISVELPCG